MCGLIVNAIHYCLNVFASVSVTGSREKEAELT